MPQATTSYSDLQIPTVNDDGNTYGIIINQFFEDLTGKIFALAAQITSAQTDLGDTNTVNTILYNINQLNAINTLLVSDGVTSDKLRTGTTVQLHPDPYGGSHTPTSSWPAYTGTGEALASISVPTTESEILNFDYQAFKTALDSIVSTISARISQAQADITAARVDICKTKKYTNAKQSGGTVERYWAQSNVIPVDFTYNGQTVTGLAGQSGTFSIGISGSSQNIANFYPGLINAGYATDQQSRTYYNTGGGSYYTLPDVNSYSIGDTVTTVNTSFFEVGNVSFLYDSLGVNNGRWTGTWEENYTLYQSSTISVLFYTLTLAQRTVYSVTGLSDCDTNPGGPHYISGSYS